MAAQTDYLTGAGTWGTAGLWQPNGAVPLDNYEAIIAPVLANDVSDAGGAANVDLDRLTIHRGYKHSFGTSGTPIQTAADVCGIYSSGPVYIECHDSATSAKLDYMIIAAARPDVIVQFGSASGAAGEVVFALCQRGKITAKQNVNWAATSEVRIGRVTGQNDVDFHLSPSISDTLPTFRQEGGKALLESRVTAGYVSNGECTVKTTHVSTMHVGAGGVVYWDDETADADDVSIHVYAGGMIDFLRTGVYKEVDNLYLYPGSNARFSHELLGFTGTDGLKDYRGSSY